MAKISKMPFYGPQYTVIAYCIREKHMKQKFFVSVHICANVTKNTYPSLSVLGNIRKAF